MRFMECVRMELTILGGSAAGPNPGQGCSGYLVQSGPTRLVVDLGPGTLPELRRHTDFRTIDGVVISHTHLDHVLDLLALRYALAYNPIRPPGPLPLWLPPGGLAFLGRLAAAFSQGPDFFAVFAASEYDPQSALIVGELAIRFRRTHHFNRCWAMRLTNSRDGDLFYTADTGPVPDLLDFAFGSAVVVAEAAETGTGARPPAERGHLFPEEAGRLAREVGADLLVLTHLWAELDPFAAIEQAAASFGEQVELAMPGLKIAWGMP
jgi:ribonuclease BN (tRNA processing enzyme)